MPLRAYSVSLGKALKQMVKCPEMALTDLISVTQVLCTWNSGDPVDILDICLLATKNKIGRKIPRVVTTNSIAIALCYKQTICVLQLGSVCCRAWFGRFVGKSVGQAQFELSLKDL